MNTPAAKGQKVLKQKRSLTIWNSDESLKNMLRNTQAKVKAINLKLIIKR
ncbi:MAG: hypothetical protein OXD32_03975 [Endozoicomonadaceae bacterium]|nr:hypothetical protein [Endozoicomonadaceae bacterium]